MREWEKKEGRTFRAIGVDGLAEQARPVDGGSPEEEKEERQAHVLEWFNVKVAGGEEGVKNSRPRETVSAVMKGRQPVPYQSGSTEKLLP